MAKAKQNGESVAGYFRKVFAESPWLLHGRSNQELLDRWLRDHPGHAEVPPKVKSNLQNLKSVLRKKDRNKKKGGRPKKSPETATAPEWQFAAPAAARSSAAPDSRLEQLEEQIDDCMVMAKGIDADELREVIALLRRARNAVVWKQGQ